MVIREIEKNLSQNVWYFTITVILKISLNWDFDFPAIMIYYEKYARVWISNFKIQDGGPYIMADKQV